MRKIRMAYMSGHKPKLSTTYPSLQGDLDFDNMDWGSLFEEALDLLRTYIRFKTVNNPESLSSAEIEQNPWRGGYEKEAANWLADQLSHDGIKVELLESAPGRINVLARLPSSGGGRSITLLSHSDVVPAERKEWHRGIDPFGAEIHDGFLYGRGVLDLKGLGIIQLMTLKLLARSRIPLARDVVLIIAADEETGGRYGAEWLLHERPNLADTALVLGEGAYSPYGLIPNAGAIQAIAVGEKGYLEIELLAEKPSHHSSMPDADNAPATLVKALARVLKQNRSIRVTSLATELLRQLSSHEHGLKKVLMQHPSLMIRLAPNHVLRSTILRSMLQDTLAVTVLAGGSKHNIVPTDARAILSIRLMPETNADRLVERINHIIADPTIRLKRLMYKPPTMSIWHTWAFNTLARHSAGQRPDILVVPILSPGASDARFWRLRGTCCYGWIPFMIPAEDLHSVHGPDERVSLSDYADGLRSYFNAVLELATTASLIELDDSPLSAN